jgi:hypothetical protein
MTILLKVTDKGTSSNSFVFSKVEQHQNQGEW